MHTAIRAEYIELQDFRRIFNTPFVTTSNDPMSRMRSVRIVGFD